VNHHRGMEAFFALKKRLFESNGNPGEEKRVPTELKKRLVYAHRLGRGRVLIGVDGPPYG